MKIKTVIADYEKVAAMELPKHKHIHHHILHNESFAKNSSGKILRAPVLEKYGK